MCQNKEGIEYIQVDAKKFNDALHGILHIVRSLIKEESQLKKLEKSLLDLRRDFLNGVQYDENI